MKLDLTMPAFEPLATALLVDDDKDIVFLLRELMLREGFIVHTAENGRDAKEFIENSKPVDIAVIDLMLPYVSGMELVTCVRDNPRWKNVPVIMLTGRVTGNDAVRALELGWSPNRSAVSPASAWAKAAVKG